jgi:hypothetical protein
MTLKITRVNMTRWNYDRRFKSFRSSISDKDYFDDLEEDIYRSFERKEMGYPDWMKGTESRIYREHKKYILRKWEKVYDAFKSYTKIAPNMNEAVTYYHTICLQDPELHALNYVRPDNRLPTYLFPWQSKHARVFNDYDIAISLDSRKIGKSLQLQFLGSFWTTNSPEHLRVFAPTDDQLFVLRDILYGMESNDFIYEEFVLGPSDVRRKQGSVTKEHAILGRNGSTIEGSNLSQTASKGKSKVGAKGSRFITDEWGLIQNHVFNTVILPMLADTSSKKKLAGFGTSTLDVNPDMEGIWDDFVNDEGIYTMMMPWTEAVRQGCLSKWYMREAGKRNHIPCPFLRTYGICGRDSLGKEVRFDESCLDLEGRLRPTMKPLKYISDPEYEDSWQCDECCYMSKSFSEEHWARFVDSQKQYWPFSMIEASADPKLSFWNGRIPQGSKPELYASVDFGLRLTHTQCLVGELLNGRMYIRDWKEISPLKDKKENMGPGAGASLFREVYDFFNPYLDHIKKYFFDITGDKMGWMSEFLVKGIDDVPGYPKKRIYQTESTKDKGLYGIESNGQFNAVWKENLRSQISAGNLIFPHRQPFYAKLLWEFKHCKIEKSQAGYLMFKEPKSGKKSIDMLDALSFLMIPLDSTFKRSSGTWYGAAGVRRVAENETRGSYNVVY